MIYKYKDEIDWDLPQELPKTEVNIIVYQIKNQ